MTRFKVLEAKCGVGRGGFACGPVGGPVIGEIKLEDENGDRFYLNLSEVDGIPNWFRTDRSTIDDQLEESSEEVFEYLNDNYIDVGEYVDVFSDPDEEMYQAYRYLIYLVRCKMELVDPFIESTVGKYLDEMEIPMSDVEEDYREEMEEEEDGEL